MRAVVPTGASPAASSQLQRGSRAAHVTAKAHVRPTGVPEMLLVGFPPGTGSGTYARRGSEQERPVFPALSAKTARISQW